MNHTPRSVVLRIHNDNTASDSRASTLSSDEVELLLQQAEDLGLPRHPDPSTAALLAAVRLRQDIPDTLYVALTAVLSRIYAAAERLQEAREAPPSP